MPRPIPVCLCALTMLAASTLGALPVFAQNATDVLRFLPSSANSLVLIDVRRLHDSQVGQQREWEKVHAERFASGSVPYPPDTQAVLLADKIDSSNWRHVQWEIGVLLLPLAPPMATIAEHEKGVMTVYNDREVVVSPRNMFLVQLNDRMLGAYYPAIRQDFTRWLRESEAQTSAPDTFLMSAAKLWPQQGQVLFALDLADSIAAEQVLQELQWDPQLKDAPNLDQLARTLAGIHGLQLTVNVTDKIEAELHVSFRDSLQAIEAQLRDLLKQGLGGLSGAKTPLEVYSWPMAVSENEVLFASTLTPEQFSELLTELQPAVADSLPHQLAKTAPSQTRPPVTAPSPPPTPAPTTEPAVPTSRGEDTKEYLTKVSRILDALDERTSRMDNYNAAALRYESTTRRLQRLPQHNVDAEVIAFTLDTANKLFQIAQSLRGVPAEAAVQRYVTQGSQYYGNQPYIYSPIYSPYWGYPWRWGHRVNVYPGHALPNPRYEAREKVARTIQNEAATRLQIWHQIRTQLASLRNEMSNKYDMPF